MTPAARMIGAAVFGLAAGRRRRICARRRGSRTSRASPRRWPAPGSRSSTRPLMAATSSTACSTPAPPRRRWSRSAPAALAMSLRHGAPTAVMGLVGGFLTPLLVGKPDAGAMPLLAYLALLDVALFAIAWRRGWTWLAAAAVLLSFVWTGYPADPAARRRARRRGLHRPARHRRLGGAAGRGAAAAPDPAARHRRRPARLAGRAHRSRHRGLGAVRRAQRGDASRSPCCGPNIGSAPPVALGLALLLLAAKAASGDDPCVPHAAIGITLLFGGGGLALTLWRNRPGVDRHRRLRPRRPGADRPRRCGRNCSNGPPGAR